MRYVISCIFGGFICFLTLNVAAVELIRHNNTNSAKEEYQLSLLKLALSYDSREYQYQQTEEYLTQTKLLSELEQGNLDVAWVGTSREYEQQFLPVRIPLFKGLLGHRIFLIKKGNQAKFDHINSLSDLSKLKGGQVSSWSDINILKQAGLTLVGTNKYQNLFYMLEGGRFDYLPRSIYSPWSEMRAHPNLNLEVEQSLMIIYPLPAYIFINKNNQVLHDKILSGLNKALDDGQFDDFFYKHPLIKQGLEQSNLANRKVFRITNSELSPETPINDERLWFNIADFIDKNKF